MIAGNLMMLRRALVIVAAIASSALAACSDQSAKLLAAETKITALEQKIDALEKRTKSIEDAREFDVTLNSLKSIAYLTPGSDGYSVLESNLGRFTVSLANIESYANGSRVTLTFGNLTSATINNPKVTIEWGTVDDKGSPNNVASHSREVEFTQSFQAGSWNNVPVVLESVPPAQLGFVRLRELTHKGISLRR